MGGDKIADVMDPYIVENNDTLVDSPSSPTIAEVAEDSKAKDMSLKVTISDEIAIPGEEISNSGSPKSGAHPGSSQNVGQNVESVPELCGSKSSNASLPLAKIFQATKTGGKKKKGSRVWTLSHSNRSSSSRVLKLEYYSEVFADDKTLQRIFKQQWREGSMRKDWWARVPVFHPDNSLRTSWNIMMAFPLVYMGSVFPYRIAFVEMKLPTDWPDLSPPDAAIQANLDWWFPIDITVDILFWIDLVLQFTFAYEDLNGQLVSHPRVIGRSYLRGWFSIDFIACLPAEFWQAILNTSGNTSKLSRISRLYRVTKIGKLTKLAQAFKLLRNHPVIFFISHMIGKSRVAQIIKFLLTLVALAHVFACGWYLIAALQDDPTKTWAWRRDVEVDGYPHSRQRLVTSSGGEQWLHSIYFVLTVFTTVGFGDITPFTAIEIIYAMLLMLMGAILHSIIISEVIAVVTRSDHANQEIAARERICNNFAARTRLSPKLHRHIVKSAVLQSKIKHAFGKQGESAFLPAEWREFCDVVDGLESYSNDAIKDFVFDGLLAQNNFITKLDGGNIGSKFAVILSAFLEYKNYKEGQHIFHSGEQPTGVFLILQGHVSFVAMPSPYGGIQHLSTIANFLKIQNAQGGENFPYMIFGQRNFFGEWEVLYPRMRQASARAETDLTLVHLSRSDFVMLCHKFPVIAEHLKPQAQRREARRHHAFAQHYYQDDYKNLAARAITKWFRAVTRKSIAEKIRLAATSGQRQNGIAALTRGPRLSQGGSSSSLLMNKLMAATDRSIEQPVSSMMEEHRSAADPATGSSREQAMPLDGAAFATLLESPGERIITPKSGAPRKLTTPASGVAASKTKSDKSSQGRTPSRVLSKDSDHEGVSKGFINKQILVLQNENKMTRDKLGEISRMVHEIYFSSFGRDQ